MKKIISLLLIFGAIYSSDQQEESPLARRRMLALGLLLQPALSFKDLQEAQPDRECVPSPTRRQRGRDIGLLSQKILACKSESEFRDLCLEVSTFCNQYRDFMDRLDFAEVDGPAQTGREVLSNSLISVLRQTADIKRWSSSNLIPDLETESALNLAPADHGGGQLSARDHHVSDDGRLTRLQRSDNRPRRFLAKKYSDAVHQDDLPLPIFRPKVGDRALSWTEVSSDGSDSDKREEDI